MFKLLVASLGVAFASPNWPTPDFSNCSFYSKAEKIFGCAKNGSDYLEGYGEIYCSRFLNESKKWNGKLKKWADNTGLCLQEMIYDNRVKRLDSCHNLEEFAFDSHPICYKQYGICKLSFSELWALKDVLRAVDIATLLKKFRRTKVQIENVWEACREEFIDQAGEDFYQLIIEDAKTTTDNIRTLIESVFLLSPKVEPHRSAYFQKAISVLLFNDDSGEALMATALYQEELESSKGKSIAEMKASTDRCFFGLSRGNSPSYCSPGVARQFENQQSFKKVLKQYKPRLTEAKLKKILRLNKYK